MAEYTMYVKDVVKKLDIKAAAMSTYPIFDEQYRGPLNDKILRHYWMREIGQETIDLFLFNLNAILWEEMPFYNQVYESTMIKFDPLSTYKLDELTESDSTMSDNRSNQSTGTNTSESDNGTRVTTFDAPTTMVSDSGDYTSAKTVTESTTTGGGESASTDQTSGTADASGTSRHSVAGRIGDSAALLRSYRAALLNVDMMVVSALDPLFMQVWNTSDSFRRGPQNVGRYLFPYGYVESR